MSQKVKNRENDKKFKLTSDGWAVLTALVLALLVSLGIIHRVPW